MRLLYFLFATISLFEINTAAAQRRSVADVLLLPELQAELALKGDDYLLLGVQGPLRTQSPAGLDLDRLGLHLGYERFWNAQWSGGAMLRADFYSAYENGSDVSKLYTDLAPELFVRHWTTSGNFNSRQRLGVEYFIPGGDSGNSRALTRLRLDLDRVFLLRGELALRPRLAYEAGLYLRLQRAEDELKERVIDFGALRAEVGVRVSPRFDFTPWLASQTSYINSLPQYDIDGNQTGGGRANLLTPVVGLDLRLTLFRGSAPFERRRLPTQH